MKINGPIMIVTVGLLAGVGRGLRFVVDSDKLLNSCLVAGITITVLVLVSLYHFGREVVLRTIKISLLAINCSVLTFVVYLFFLKSGATVSLIFNIDGWFSIIKEFWSRLELLSILEEQLVVFELEEISTQARNKLLRGVKNPEQLVERIRQYKLQLLLLEQEQLNDKWYHWKCFFRNLTAHDVITVVSWGIGLVQLVCWLRRPAPQVRVVSKQENQAINDAITSGQLRIRSVRDELQTKLARIEEALPTRADFDQLESLAQQWGADANPTRDRVWSIETNGTNRIENVRKLLLSLEPRLQQLETIVDKVPPV